MAKAQVYNYYCDMCKQKKEEKDLTQIKLGSERTAPKADLCPDCLSALKKDLGIVPPAAAPVSDGNVSSEPVPDTNQS